MTSTVCGMKTSNLLFHTCLCACLVPQIFLSNGRDHTSEIIELHSILLSGPPILPVSRSFS